MDKNKPEKIGKYLIQEELGRGSTSIVYKAQDPFENREVAIKAFNAKGIENEEERKKFSKLFVTESSIAGKLNHPHIINIYDAVVNPEDGYIVMEVAHGKPLDEFATVGKLLPIQTVMELIFKCCTALDFASTRGIIHRDIKPANIMYSDNGDIKLTDFGAALLLNVDHTQTLGVGSPAYMSPEQIEERTLTHQTDIYSLGIVMFKLLTGRLPFDAETTYSLMHKIVNEPPINIRTLLPNIPEELAVIVHRAIEKKTKDRYQQWADIVSDLASCVNPSAKASKKITDSEKFSMLKSLPFFSNFTEVELWELLQISNWAKFPSDRVLMREGNSGRSFYMLVDGEVSVTKKGKILTTLGKGDCFGEMAYIDKKNAKRSANIISNSPVVLIKIKAAELEAATDGLQLKFNRIFLQTLVQRLSQANAELVSLVA